MVTKKLFAMMAGVVLLVGVSSCAVDDNPAKIVLSPEEQALVGFWYDEFDYAGITEDSIPFTRVLLAVDVESDRTGCLYLGVFDDESDEPLVIYGGPDDAGFNWALLPDGRVQISDPASGESVALSRTRGDDGGVYGKDMTNVSETNLAYTGNVVTVNNTAYSGTLAKADADKQSATQDKLTISAKSPDGTRGTYRDSNGRSRECIVVTINGKKFAVATANETQHATYTTDGVAFYSWTDACRYFAVRTSEGTSTKANVWRLPTKKEAEDFGKVESKGIPYTTPCKRTWLVGSAKLDLPIDGGYDNTGKKLVKVYSRGYYWTSKLVPSGDSNVYALEFSASDAGDPVCELNGYPATHRLSVRLFCKLPTK